MKQNLSTLIRNNLKIVFPNPVICRSRRFSVLHSAIFASPDGAEQIRCCKGAAESRGCRQDDAAEASRLFVFSFCSFPLNRTDNQLLGGERQRAAACTTASHTNAPSHTLALQLESISIITSLLSWPHGKSIAAPYEVKPPAPGAPLLTPKNDTLC